MKNNEYKLLKKIIYALLQVGQYIELSDQLLKHSIQNEC